MIVAPIVVRGGASSSSVALGSPLGSSTYLMARASMWGWSGWRGFSRRLIALAAAAVTFPLNFGGDRRDEGGGEIRVCELGSFGDGGVGEEGRGGGEVSESLDGVVQVTLFGPFELWHFFECQGKNGGEGAGFLFEFSLEFRTALEDVVLGGEALLEFLCCSVEYWRAEPSRGQVRAGKLGAFLVFSNVFETVVDPPVYHAEGFVQD
jgi:hypothetical protein